MALWIGTSAVIGYPVTQVKQITTHRFVAESCMTVGMIGTVIGFILMLGSSFAGLDPATLKV